MFDRTATRVFTGVVSHVEPGPDHLQIFFAPLTEQRDGVERDEQGKPILWSLEMTGAASVAKYGITVPGFAPGTVFSGALHPARDGGHAGFIYRTRDNLERAVQVSRTAAAAAGPTLRFGRRRHAPRHRYPNAGAVERRRRAITSDDGIDREASMRSATFSVLVFVASIVYCTTAQEALEPRVKGDQQRRYDFSEARAEMPYRLYVPQSYDPARKTPLVVALHGYGGDQNYFFASLPTLPDLLERHGFIFVAPMGFAADGWYGAPLSIPGNAPRSSGAPTPTPLRTPEEETRYRALSETDVMNVIDIVRAEYAIDPDRIYLMGHSMGGFGTWWLGQKHADLWAAIAPMSGRAAERGLPSRASCARAGPRLDRRPRESRVGGRE